MSGASAKSRKHETHPFDAGWVAVDLNFHGNAPRRASATAEGVHGLMSHERLGYALPENSVNEAWFRRMTMRSFPYVQLDVFTQKALEGNQLAVFTDARGLSAADMQALARETRLAETT